VELMRTVFRRCVQVVRFPLALVSIALAVTPSAVATQTRSRSGMVIDYWRTPAPPALFVMLTDADPPGARIKAYEFVMMIEVEASNCLASESWIRQRIELFDDATALAKVAVRTGNASCRVVRVSGLPLRQYVALHEQFEQSRLNRLAQTLSFLQQLNQLEQNERAVRALEEIARGLRR
jgi:hypothetical protein